MNKENKQKGESLHKSKIEIAVDTLVKHEHILHHITYLHNQEKKKNHDTKNN